MVKTSDSPLRQPLKIYNHPPKTSHANCIWNTIRCGLFFEFYVLIVIRIWEKKLGFLRQTSQHKLKSKWLYYEWLKQSLVIKYVNIMLIKVLFVTLLNERFMKLIFLETWPHLDRLTCYEISPQVVFGFINFLFCSFQKTHKSRQQTAACFWWKTVDNISLNWKIR